jgi:hypothetical protein
VARLGEILLSIGSCDEAAVERALRGQAFFGARLGTHLLRLGAVEEAVLAEVLGRLHGVPGVHGDVRVDPEARALVPRRLVERYGVVPYLVVSRDLAVLVPDPTDLRMLDDLAFATGKVIHPFVAPETRLWALLGKLYGIRRGLRGLELEAVPAGAPVEPTPPRRTAAVEGDLMTEEEFAELYRG